MKFDVRIAAIVAGVFLSVLCPHAGAHTNVTVEQARDLLDSVADLVIVDVRESYEFNGADGHLPGALNYPWNSGVLQARYTELATGSPILVVCASGGRSNQAANFLDSQGFAEVYDMQGGMRAWVREMVDFADANLQAAVEAALGKNFPMIGDMAGLTELVADGENITDLTGLETATDLRILSLVDNQISDLSPLAELTALTELHLEGNPLSSEACQVTIPQIRENNAGITITYDPCVIDTCTLTVSSTAGGSVITPGEGVFTYDYGTEVTLEADADPGCHFINWSEDAFGTDTSTTITMDGDRRVEAVFAVEQHTLTVSCGRGGCIVEPGEGPFQYDRGDRAWVKAIADPLYAFSHWSGDLASTETTVTIDMDRDYDIRANFVSVLDVLYVDNDAPNDPGPGDPARSDPNEDGTAAHPFDAIQEAIDVAAAHSQVTVRPGTYVENIDLLGKSIRLTGLADQDPNAAAYPVIDGNDLATTVTFAGREDANCVVEGFVITGGRGQRAGGVYCYRSSPTLLNCLIVGNRAVSRGGGVRCVTSNAVFANCTFSGNYGGPDGGGLYVTDSNCVLVDSIIWDNLPGEVRAEGTSDPYLAYCDVAGGWPADTIATGDPCFAAPGYWAHRADLTALADPADPNALWVPGDYHLQSQAGRWDPLAAGWVTDDVTSPCIDVGDPHAPVADEPQPNGARLNLGAYGGTIEASKSYPPQ